MQKYYTARMDRLLRITTRVVWAVLLLPPVMLSLNFLGLKGQYAPHPGGGGLPFAIAGVTLLVAAIAYFTRALAPRGFALNDAELTIDRAMQPIVIPLSSITEVRRLEDAEVKRALRVFGASGFYGHYGNFWNKALGGFRMYACRSKDLVLVRTEKVLFVLGPDAPGEFVADLRPLIRR